MVVSKKGSRQWQYWKIKKTKEIRYDTDEEYEEEFRKIYTEAVRCRLRSIKKIGISLSGGLDSGSTACLSAAELKKRDVKLYSFTQIPMKGYENWLTNRQIADESDYVNEIIKHSGNTEPHFLDCEGKSPLTEIDSLIEILEQPYKILENSYWFPEILKTASDMGCGVMLTGQSGNATVSWGSFTSYFLYLFKSKHLLRYFHDIWTYCKQKKVNYLHYVYSNLLYLMPYPLQKLRQWLLKREKIDYLLSPVSHKLYHAVHEGKRLNTLFDDPHLLTVMDSFHQRMKMLNPATFSHIGAMETKLSLAFGIEQRDPTRDKRLIEFCINLPEDKWLMGGVERGFIRSAMKGYMPDKVRLNSTIKGRQAADWVQRIIPAWNETRLDISKIGDTVSEQKYLDIPRIKNFLDENKNLNIEDDGLHGLKLLIRSLIFSRFLHCFEE
jgi:asparagine synthase (glutamine-hydrolysing)